MNEALLAIFQKAYQDLDLFPLIEPEEIERFRVDYGREVLVRLKQEVNASTKAQKFVFAGHRGCGKSTLLKRFAVEMQPQHFVVFFSIANLIEPSAVTHRNILYAIALQLLSAATDKKIPVADDIKESLLGWMNTTHKQKAEQTLKSEAGLGVDKRISADCIEPDTARKMVLKSGGVMRELVRIARECCTECMVKLELEPDCTDLKINDQILDAALRNLRNDFARQIGTALFPVLVQVYETLKSKDMNSDAFVKLLHGLMVLEYQNDELWYDVHPIVVDLLQQEGLIGRD